MSSILLVSPHSDDAALSAFRLLSTGDASVLTVCGGVPPTGTQLSSWDEMTGAEDARERALERKDEDVAAMTRLGVDLTQLEYLDNSYRSQALDLSEIAEQIALVASGRSLLAPMAIGSHPDHESIRDATMLAGHKYGNAVGFYAELPYAARHGWPKWVTGESQDPFLRPEISWREAIDWTRVSESGATVEHLDEVDRNKKYDLISEYRSQLPALNNGPLDRFRVPAILSYEVWWHPA